MLTSIMISPGSTGIDEPPGITAFRRRPSRTPPAIARSSRKGVPRGISKLPGLLTCPETENTLVPPEFSTPSSRNQSGPLRTIDGTEANVSVLLTVVGRP